MEFKMSSVGLPLDSPAPDGPLPLPALLSPLLLDVRRIGVSYLTRDCSTCTMIGQ